VHIVDEMHAEEVVAAVKRLQPRAIFLDTLCNTSTIPVPHLAVLIPAIASFVKQQTYLVLDNSGLGPTCRPSSYLPRLSRLRLLVVESLNKHYEFGLDRVAGGVVWGDGRFVGRLSTYRMHLGTNIPDATVHTVPWPDGELLRARMNCQGRNAKLIAEKIEAHVKAHPNSMVSHVVYPGLSTHPSYKWTNTFLFHGCFFSLAFKPTYAKVFVYLRYLAAVLSEAKKVKADVVTGTDFGLSTTRVYLTALHAQRMALPFVRISAGTETRVEAEVLADVFIRAIDRLSKWAIIM
jgi:cystathionine beta-lyase/cystathionine gamma-synthase